jgi:predicted acyltransferase
MALAASFIWSEALPYNKKLWTSSYALLNIGLDTLILALLTDWIDRRGRRAMTSPLAILGGNTLAVYVFSELGNAALSRTWIGDTDTFIWIHSHLYAPWAGAKLGSLLYSLTFLLICWFFARELARRHVRIRL